jgi:glucose/arabinose dehydrogenase
MLAAGLATLFLPVLPGCYGVTPPQGGANTEFRPPRQVNPADVLLPPGYRIEAVATGLTFPTGIAFDEQGRSYVTEAGYSYGEVFTTPRLLRLEPGGATTEVARGDNAPWTGVAFHRGAFFVTGGGQTPGLGGQRGGEVLRITPDGRVTALVQSLPSRADHHTNAPTPGPDGWIYFAQGVATNSGVVGPDSWTTGWLKRHPGLHDIPCQDIRLTGANHDSENPTGSGPARVATGAFVPFGTPTAPGQVIRGRVPCGGAVLRVRPEGGPVQLVAWGLRNPFGLAFAHDGALYATDNSYDVRGSRPVFGTGDLLWRVEQGRWYGWPDFHDGQPIDEANRFGPVGRPTPRRLLAELPGQPPRAAAVFGVHASADGLDFAPRSGAFGPPGRAFVALFGDQGTNTGKQMGPVGFKVVSVDPRTGVVEDFASNRGRSHGPASYIGRGGLERPVAVRFDPGGTALWIVDFGVMTARGTVLQPVPATGVVWRVTRDPAAARPVAAAAPPRTGG